MTDTALSAEQIESFVEHGCVRIGNRFTREDAQPWLYEARLRSGYDRDDPSTWVERRIHMSSLRHADFAPDSVAPVARYRPAAPREHVAPDRVRRQTRMREEEEGRLAEASS